MISLKKYIDQAGNNPKKHSTPDAKEVLPVAIAAFRSALLGMGNCTLDVCPALGKELQQSLGKLEENLSIDITREAVEATGKNVQEQLQDWGKRTTRHFQQRTDEIKEILIVMARTAEAVGERDQRCAIQINEVTAQLQRIASLEDLTQIRASLKRSAAELKTSIERMAAEGKAAIEQAQVEISSYQTKLKDAEQISSCDSLTGLRSRSWVENQIERRILAKLPLCVAIIDLDGFKQVNDDYGHLIGDELLQQFASELKSACRSTDVIGRWGGDEFIILLDCGMLLAKAQTDRLREWVCGDYTLQTKVGPMKRRVVASIGLAEHEANESIKVLLARADAEMYQQKAKSRGKQF
jgi:diguanylate cyclase (GGDEF)-like protein